MVRLAVHLRIAAWKLALEQFGILARIGHDNGLDFLAELDLVPTPVEVLAQEVLDHLPGFLGVIGIDGHLAEEILHRKNVRVPEEASRTTQATEPPSVETRFIVRSQQRP